MFRVRCPSCEQLLGIPEGTVGNTTTCPQCARQFRVSATDEVKMPRPRAARAATRPQDAPSRTSKSATKAPRRAPARSRDLETSPEFSHSAEPPRGRLIWMIGVTVVLAVGGAFTTYQVMSPSSSQPANAVAEVEDVPGQLPPGLIDDFQKQMAADQEVEQRLGVEDQIIAKLTTVDALSEPSAIVRAAKEIELAHPQEPLVLQHAALAYLKGNDPKSAASTARRALELFDSLPMDQQPSKAARAQLLTVLGTADLERGAHKAAATAFREAANLDPTLLAKADLVGRLADELSPTPEALLVASDVTGRLDELPETKFEINVDGVLQLAPPWFYEEVRGRILRMLHDNSLIMECRDEPDGPPRHLRFPFLSVYRVFRDNEVETTRVDAFAALGFNSLLSISDLPINELFNGFVSNKLLGKDSESRTLENRYIGLTRVYTGSSPFLHQMSGGRAEREPSAMIRSDATDDEIVIALWRTGQNKQRHLTIPNTWTRSWAKYQRDREAGVEMVVKAEAAQFLNLPLDGRNPYPIWEQSEVDKSLQGLLVFAHTIKKGVANADQNKQGTSRPHIADSIAEIAGLYLTMDQRHRDEFLRGALLVRQGIGLVYQLGRQSKFEPAESPFRTLTRNAQTAPNRGRANITVRVVGRDGKPAQKDLRFDVYFRPDDVVGLTFKELPRFTDVKGEFVIPDFRIGAYLDLWHKDRRVEGIPLPMKVVGDQVLVIHAQ